MRLTHSTLNDHSYLYHLAHSNLCTCGKIENKELYFLDCPKYATLRTVLLTSMAEIISPGVHFSLLLHMDKKYVLELILHGSSDLSLHENELLFQFVQLYIRESRRFENIFRFKISLGVNSSLSGILYFIATYAGKFLFVNLYISCG